jgi:glycosyltransferase involved in cell wall biosynthesis
VRQTTNIDEAIGKPAQAGPASQPTSKGTEAIAATTDTAIPAEKNTGRPARVLVVGPMPPTKGGVTTFMLNLMASHLKDEFDFTAFTTSRPPKRNVIDNWGYGALLRGGPRRILTGILITLGHLIKFPFVIVGKRIDIVQIQASDYLVFWESVLYSLMARMLGRPVIFRLGGAFDIFHAESPPPIRRLISAALNMPQYIVAQSAFASGCIRRAGRRGPMVVLPNWSRAANIVDVFRPASAKPTFLFIAGTEARRKGIEEILAAAQQLDRSGSPAQFHFIAMTPSLVERAAALGLSNVRAVEGPAPHDRVLELMRRSDVFLLPSHGEGFPNSLVEAMGASMASIVTPVGAVPEIVADGGALTIPIGNMAALAEAIDRLARNPDLRQKLGREARNTVRGRYTEEAALPPLAEAYRHALHRGAVKA